MVQSLITILFLGAIAVWAYKVVYSLFYSPLKEIPGPVLLQLFPFIYLLKQIGGNEHIFVSELHEKYGEVVRIGWSTVSFNNLKAYKEIYSTYKYTKADFYLGFRKAGETTFSTQSKEYHRNRKKVLLPSFSDNYTLQMENNIRDTGVYPLIDKIKKYSEEQQNIELGTLFNFATFDITGIILFNKSFDILKNDFHPVASWIDTYFHHGVVRGTFRFLDFYTDSGLKNLFKLAYDQIGEYTKNHVERKCLMDSFIEAMDTETGHKLSLKEVAEELVLQIGAGTDTTASTLTWVFYFLLKDPKAHKRLKEEVRAVFSNLNDISYIRCKNECPYLNAIICETLRLKPVASILLPRKVPAGGATIMDYFLPEGTVVGTNLYCLQRLEKHYQNPDYYLPERWIDSNGQFQNHEAFFPFSLGPRACIGRNLAWVNLMNITASLIYYFDMELKDKNVILHDFNNIVLKAEGELLVKV